MRDLILKEMKENGADGVEFVPIMANYEKFYTVICNLEIEEIENDNGISFPKSGRRYYKKVNGTKVYIDNLKNDKEDENINKPNKMLNKGSWETFRNSGLLWWTNTLLHTFGWALVIEYDDNEKIINAYPSRTKFRGFSDKNNSDGYIKISQYMKDNAEELLKEANE